MGISNEWNGIWSGMEWNDVMVLFVTINCTPIIVQTYVRPLGLTFNFK